MSYRSVTLIYNIYRGCHIGLNRFLSLWNWNLEILFFAEEGNPENLEKAHVWHQLAGIQATLMGSEHSSHCAIPAVF